MLFISTVQAAALGTRFNHVWSLLQRIVQYDKLRGATGFPKYGKLINAQTPNDFGDVQL